MIVARFTEQLDDFADLPRLQVFITHVLESLPEEIQLDFCGDATFRITLEDVTPGQGWKLFMNCPSPVDRISRCVVLRSKLEDAPADFAKYIVAHEFAHAYLRNGGWGAIDDPEQAADELAATWGFARPHISIIQQFWRSIQ